MVLLEGDLKDQFNIVPGLKDKVEKRFIYDYLSKAREENRSRRFQKVHSDLKDATERDKKTHTYFDALLSSDNETAYKLFRENYLSMKKLSCPEKINLDIAFAIDVTGSMRPYMTGISALLKSMLSGENSIKKKLAQAYPKVKFNLRVGAICYRDLDDKRQFHESTLKDGCHFTSSMNAAIQFIESMTANASGGFDLAEDHLGAINRCGTWSHSDDWTAAIKCMILFTDAPAHSMSPENSIQNADDYSVRHPLGLTSKIVADTLAEKDINFFFCSFNPSVTSCTEKNLARAYLEHPENKENHEITAIPMVAPGSLVTASRIKHIIFVLDESSSMLCNWAGVVEAYKNFMSRRLHDQVMSDIISVVQFSNSSRITLQTQSLSTASRELSHYGGGTKFYPAAKTACQIVRENMDVHDPIIIFMSDGEAADAAAAAAEFSSLRNQILQRHNRDLELHVIAFGLAKMTQLQKIASSSDIGKLYTSADTAELSNIFVNIASRVDVASLVETEVAKRVSDLIEDRLSLEFMATGY